MSRTRASNEILDRDFLEMRCRILDLAAALDRLDHAPEPPGHSADHRLAQIRQAIEALLESEPRRGETIQRIFSLEYDPQWRERNGPLTPRT